VTHLRSLGRVGVRQVCAGNTIEGARPPVWVVPFGLIGRRGERGLVVTEDVVRMRPNRLSAGSTGWWSGRGRETPIGALGW
jgi:hypothetical protein